MHEDDDLIVSHIAITVTDMAALKKRLEEMKVPSRKNVSVPNPDDDDTGIVQQQFIRDPDGYYIECCNCELLERFLHNKMAEAAGKWNFFTVESVMHLKPKMLAIEEKAKLTLEKQVLDFDQVLENLDMTDKVAEPDPVKLANLIKRRQVYADITQNATEEELAKLLRFYNNVVPSVIGYLENKIRVKGTRTFIPPAFYDRDGTFLQPPSFEMPIKSASYFTTYVPHEEEIEKNVA